MYKFKLLLIALLACLFCTACSKTYDLDISDTQTIKVSVPSSYKDCIKVDEINCGLDYTPNVEYADTTSLYFLKDANSMMNTPESWKLGHYKEMCGMHGIAFMDSEASLESADYDAFNFQAYIPGYGGNIILWYFGKEAEVKKLASKVKIKVENHESKVKTNTNKSTDTNTN